MTDISTSAWLDDTFTSLSDHWTTESAPRTVREWTTQKRAQSIKAPPCGKTVCDDPAVIRNYESRLELRSKKVSVIAYAMCAYLFTYLFTTNDTAVKNQGLSAKCTREDNFHFGLINT